MTLKNTQEVKVLGFDTAQGKVPCHAILTYQYDWFASDKDIHTPWITAVVFEEWDNEASVTIKVTVGIHDLTRYIKRKWPHGGSLRAIVLSNGRVLPCDARYSRPFDGHYEKMPLLARDLVYGVTGGHVVFEIAGVRDYLSSNRGQEDEALILDPYARDRAKYEAEQRARGAA